MWGKEDHWNFRQEKLKLLAAGNNSFFWNTHRILQVSFTLLWKDRYGSDFYYGYYQNPVLGLKQKTQALCHNPSSCSSCSLIHEVPQFSYFNHFLASITTGFFLWLTILAVDLPRCLKSSLYFFYSWDYCSHHTQQLLFYYSLLHFSVATNISALLFTYLNPVSHLKETKMCETSLHRNLT